MNVQKDVKNEKTDFQRDFQENSTNCKFNLGNKMARGAGFEPARPKRTTGLAGIGIDSAPYQARATPQLFFNSPFYFILHLFLVKVTQ